MTNVRNRSVFHVLQNVDLKDKKIYIQRCAQRNSIFIFVTIILQFLMINALNCLPIDELKNVANTLNRK